jgi:hypothetical protein
LNYVCLAVVARRLFEVHGAQQDLRRDVARHQAAFLERFEMKSAGTPRRGGDRSGHGTGRRVRTDAS